MKTLHFKIIQFQPKFWKKWFRSITAKNLPLHSRVPENEVVMEHVCWNIEYRKILHDINLTFNAGEITCILGTNGSGKTTLIYLLTGKSK